MPDPLLTLPPLARPLSSFSVGELNSATEVLDFSSLEGQVVLCVNVASF